MSNPEELNYADLDWEEISREVGIRSPAEFEKLTIEAAVLSRDSKYRNPNLYFKEKYFNYPQDPVSPERWLSDTRYFGHVGNSVWPQIREDFLSIVLRNPRPLRVCLTGSIGWGKTFLSCLLMGWLLYELNCYRSPQKFFGLAPGTHITLMNLSVSAVHARRVLFDSLKEMIDGSPWFRTISPRKTEYDRAIHFPRTLVSFIPGSSSELAPLGENLFGGVLEEANFFPVVKQSKKIHNPAEQEWDQAKKLHDGIWRRMQSRYQRKGRLPGMLVLNSSASYPDDFMERIVKENDPNTMVIHHAEWETKPSSRYSGEKFYVFIGEQHLPPRIVGNENEKQELEQKGRVIAVPVEYRPSFEKDIEGAIRDIAGLNIRSMGRFITNRDAILKCVDHRLIRPFDSYFEEGIPYENLSSALRIEKLINPIVNMKKCLPIPYINPDAVRYCHIDLGLSHDACGIVVCHIAGNKEVLRTRENEMVADLVKEVVPFIVVDFMLRIIPPQDGEIEIEGIRNIIHDLVGKVGYRFGKITYDQFQSKDSQQILKKRFGESVVGYLSVDKTSNQYNVLKETIYENRLRFYYYEPIIRELSNLVLNEKTRKVDHPPHGSKDVADALAGAVWNAVTDMENALKSEIIIEETPNYFLKRSEPKQEVVDSDEVVSWLLDRPVKKERRDTLTEEELEEMSLSENEKMEILKTLLKRK